MEKNVVKRKRHTYEEIELIFKDHIENKLYLKELEEKYHISNISSYFKKYGFEYKDYTKDVSKRKANKLKINYFFENITNETEAYILGLWMSDGTVGDCQAKLKLKESDRDLLEQIQKYICPDETIKKEKNNYKIVISSEYFCQNLWKLGCVKNKTYSEMHIPKINKDLLRHFIRGYFDGDGTVFFDRKYIKSNICSICGSFLEELKEVLLQSGIECRINIEKRKGKALVNPQGEISTECKDMYRLYVSKKDAVKRFVDYMYKNATIYLQRKKDIFDKMQC